LSASIGSARATGQIEYVGTVRVDKILVGTLVIDIVDAAKGEMVWRGLSQDTQELSA
jgi:hypothetical protein